MIPDSVQIIHENAFATYKQLTKIIFGDESQLREIHGFQMTGIHEIKIPRMVQNISRSAFIECDRLTRVTFHAGCQSQELLGFKFCQFSCLKIPDSIVILGEHLYSIPNLKFGNRLLLQNFIRCIKCDVEMIRIPDSLEIIPMQMFSNCPKLQFVKFDTNSRLKEIDGFENCLIERITIPDRVEIIGKTAFRKCYQLQYLEFRPTSELHFCKCLTYRNQFFGFPEWYWKKKCHGINHLYPIFHLS